MMIMKIGTAASYAKRINPELYTANGTTNTTKNMGFNSLTTMGPYLALIFLGLCLRIVSLQIFVL